MPATSQKGPSRLAILKNVITKPAFAAVFVIGSVIYYFFIKYIITISSQGVFLVVTPAYLLYLLSATSGLLLSISIYSINLSFRYSTLGIEEGVASAVTTFAGSLITSCGCTAPILSTILYSVGMNAIGVSGVLSSVYGNQYVILGGIVVLNLLFIYYSLGKIAPSCKIDRRGRIIPKG